VHEGGLLVVRALQPLGVLEEGAQPPGQQRRHLGREPSESRRRAVGEPSREPSERAAREPAAAAHLLVFGSYGPSNGSLTAAHLLVFDEPEEVVHAPPVRRLGLPEVRAVGEPLESR
jgi:hypothetical protein